MPAGFRRICELRRACGVSDEPQERAGPDGSQKQPARFLRSDKSQSRGLFILGAILERLTERLHVTRSLGRSESDGSYNPADD
jgi:hypothetical protein